MHITEADWRKCKKHISEWRERYIKQIRILILDILSDGGKTATEAFWKIKEIIDKEADILMNCLDDCKRSNIQMQLLSMYKNNLITNDDLTVFSDEFKTEMGRMFKSL